MKDKRAIAASFAKAAPHYDAVSEVQSLAARRLAASIDASWAAPAILDYGVGTGHLAQALRARWPDASLTLADLAPAMLHVAQAKLPAARLVAADLERPPFAPAGFDLVASNLALQWCDDLPATLRGLAGLLRPGGQLAVTTLLADSWIEWRRAHEVLGLAPALQPLPAEAALRASLPWVNRFEVATILRPYLKGREFLRDISRLGAGLRHGAALSPRDLSRVLRQFEASGPVASYQLATIHLNRPSRAGAMVLGTDTGIGKTVVSAILCRAWDADYWKPVQTGLADEPGDGAFVADLGIRAHPPRHELQAPLSPYDAARLEKIPLALADFDLPASSRPLVVETAGGVASPLDAAHDMADLAAHCGLPAVLVARSGLGTINHTLLAIEKSRRRGVFILGVVMVGTTNPANAAEIERRGNVQVLLECPHLERLDQETIQHIAAQMPQLAELGRRHFNTQGWFTNC